MATATKIRSGLGYDLARSEEQRRATVQLRTILIAAAIASAVPFTVHGQVLTERNISLQLALTIANAAMAACKADGFDGVAREFLRRLSRERQTSRRIDDNGDLLLRRIGTDKVERLDLMQALAAPSWFDSKLGGPRL